MRTKFMVVGASSGMICGVISECLAFEVIWD